MGNLDWMDEKTKERARMKLDHMDEVSLVRLLRAFPPKSETFFGFETNCYPLGSIVPKDSLACQAKRPTFNTTAYLHLLFFHEPFVQKLIHWKRVRLVWLIVSENKNIGH